MFTGFKFILKSIFPKIYRTYKTTAENTVYIIMDVKQTSI